MNCLITGASIGIGNSLALKLASLGYNLYLTYFSNQEFCYNLKEEIETKYKVKCFIEKLDLKEEENIKNIIKDFNNKLGNLDLLINNASTSCDNLIHDKTKKEFMEVLEVNLVGTFLMSKYAKEIMNSNGKIINMSSTDGIDTYSIYNIDYSVSKAAIIQLTKCLALIYPDIKVIALAPNWVDTESTNSMNQEYLKAELKRIGQDKLITKERVVEVILGIINNQEIKSGEVIKLYE